MAWVNIICGIAIFPYIFAEFFKLDTCGTHMPNQNVRQFSPAIPSRDSLIKKIVFNYRASHQTLNGNIHLISKTVAFSGLLTDFKGTLQGKKMERGEKKVPWKTYFVIYWTVQYAYFYSDFKLRRNSLNVAKFSHWWNMSTCKSPLTHFS